MVGAVALLCFVSLGIRADEAGGTTNVIVILADDLGYGDLGPYGGTRIRTPHIDALASGGARFTAAYSSANVCTPARAGLLTGRYPIRSGLAWEVLGAESESGLPGSEQTFAELALTAGYRTMMVGKWHLGRLPEFSPLQHGFENFFGVPYSNDMPRFALFDGDTMIEQPVRQDTLTMRYTQKAVEFIEANVDRPFLLYLAHTFPHIPLFASERFTGVSAAGAYGDVVEELDWSTGQIISALRRNGLIDDTLVIFTSDNGPFFEGSTAGIRGAKGGTWDGGYRVPFIAHWPSEIAAGRVTGAITMNIDLLPTIADIVDRKPAGQILDGRSLLPLLRGASSSPHDHLLLFNNETIVGLRTQQWKYLTHTYYRRSLGAFEKFGELPGFAGAYEMLLTAEGVEGEAYSYADRHPDILRRMRSQLALARQRFDPLRTHPPDNTYPE